MTEKTVDMDPSKVPRPSLRERFVDALNRVQFVIYLTLVLSFLAIGFLWKRMFIVIAPGHRGVMYRPLSGGTVTNRFWEEGLHVIPPWDKMYKYEVRLKQSTIDFNVLSDEGLSLGVKVVVRHRPQEDMLGYLHRDIGPDYFDRLIQPEVEAHIRRTFGGRPAHEIYASVRDVLQEVGQLPLIGRAEVIAKATSTRPYVYVQELKLVGITLPRIVEEAILEKYRQEQLMLAYKYKLEREEKEADRKRIEAAGIRDFNMIAGRVSPDMLRWRSIDAALDLAKSNNSKVIMLGGAQSAPMMQLNLGDSPLVPPSVEPPAKEEPLPKKPATKPIAKIDTAATEPIHNKPPVPSPQTSIAAGSPPPKG